MIHFGDKNALRAMIKALKSHGNFSKVFKVSPISHILHLLENIVYLKLRVPEVVVNKPPCAYSNKLHCILGCIYHLMVYKNVSDIEISEFDK